MHPFDGQQSSNPRMPENRKQQRVSTALGFDLLLDPGDYLSKLLERDGVFEAAEADLASRLVRLGDICVDAGCHMGFYSCLVGQVVGPSGHVFAFDANPYACRTAADNVSLNRLPWVEVVNAALADGAGKTAFHISTDDQTGLSSIGPISNTKEVISVETLRLEDFLQQRAVKRLRLIKIDVEGSEGLVLRGLGRFLTEHLVDFVLLELYDERLQLLNTSTAEVAEILSAASYKPWTHTPHGGWTPVTEVHSRGDCNYLFVSPSIKDGVPRFSLAGVLSRTQEALAEEQQQNAAKGRDIEQLKQDITTLQQKVEHLQNDIIWLTGALTSREQEVKCVEAEKQQLGNTLSDMENSASWRMLNRWRNLRNRLAPEDTLRRRVYDRVLRPWRHSRA